MSGFICTQMSITTGGFRELEWDTMLAAAAASADGLQDQKLYVYRTIFSGVCFLELKTAEEMQKLMRNPHYQGAVKMSLREMINITRISLLNTTVDRNKESIRRYLNIFAARAEAKYNQGLKGKIRRIVSIIFNLFAKDAVTLFRMPGTTKSVEVQEATDRNQLPRIIGSNAAFARHVSEMKILQDCWV